MAREVRITVRGVPREQPDLRRLARALLEAVRAEQCRRAQRPADSEAAAPEDEEAAS
ncbi:MAG: hypothetical protein ACJ74O_06305 [Frankiaceae bacterium]